MVAQPALDVLEATGAEQLLRAARAAPPSAPAGRTGSRPCGSIATWVNWVTFMPSSRVTRCPVSSSRLDSGAQPPSTLLATIVTDACCVVVPVPRFLGRSQAGERTIRNRRPRQRGLEADPGGDAGRGVVAAQPAGGVAVAGDVAVEREADGVEDAGLARPGRRR